jgi:hypothetical protein
MQDLGLHRKLFRCCVEESRILPSNGQTRHCPKITACPVSLVHAPKMPFTDLSTRSEADPSPMALKSSNSSSLPGTIYVMDTEGELHALRDF